MATDRNGKTPAVGDRYLLAGRVASISGDRLTIVTGDQGQEVRYVEDADVMQIDDVIQGKAPRENGFVDRAQSTLSFVDGTRTFSITPVSGSFEYYHQGKLYTVSSADSVVIPDTENIHFVYYDGSTLKTTTVQDAALIVTYTLVAAVYWDATNNAGIYFGDERHGSVMDSRTHAYNHQTYGARFDQGLGLQSLSVDGSGDLAVHAQFGVGNGVIWDEDIRFPIDDGSPQDLEPLAKIPIYYRTGANGDWRRIAATDYPITTTGSGRAAWNEDTGSTWQLTEVDNHDFVLVHYFATPNTLAPIIGIVGQAEYNTVAEARAGALIELQLLANEQIGGLTPEFVAIATVIWQTSNNYSNAVKSRTRSTDAGDDYIDWRALRGGIGGVSVASANWGEIGGTLSNQTDLQAALDAKADKATFGTILLRDTTGQNVDGASAVVVQWNTEDHKDTGFTHSTTTNNGEISIDETGLYMVCVNLVLVGTGAPRWNGFLTIQKDTGSGFVDTNYQVANGYIRQQDNHNTTGLSMALAIRLNTEDKIRLTVQRESIAIATSVANQSTSTWSVTRLQ